MTKLYQVILSDTNGKDSNIIVKDEHLDDYLYHAGFSVKDCYYVGELYEVEPICHKERGLNMTKQDRLKQLHDRAIKIRKIIDNGKRAAQTYRILIRTQKEFIRISDPETYYKYNNYLRECMEE